MWRWYSWHTILTKCRAKKYGSALYEKPASRGTKVALTSCLLYAVTVVKSGHSAAQVFCLATTKHCFPPACIRKMRQRKPLIGSCCNLLFDGRCERRTPIQTHNRFAAYINVIKGPPICRHTQPIFIMIEKARVKGPHPSSVFWKVFQLINKQNQLI